MYFCQKKKTRTPNRPHRTVERTCGMRSVRPWVQRRHSYLSKIIGLNNKVRVTEHGPSRPWEEVLWVQQWPFWERKMESWTGNLLVGKETKGKIIFQSVVGHSECLQVLVMVFLLCGRWAQIKVPIAWRCGDFWMYIKVTYGCFPCKILSVCIFCCVHLKPRWRTMPMSLCCSGQLLYSGVAIKSGAKTKT